MYFFFQGFHWNQQIEQWKDIQERLKQYVKNNKSHDTI